MELTSDDEFSEDFSGISGDGSESDSDSNAPSMTIKDKCESLHEKLNDLIYENESLRSQLKATQESMVSLNEDKQALLDRLLTYEKIDQDSTESDTSESSAANDTPKETKRRKLDTVKNILKNSTSNVSTKKKRAAPKGTKPQGILQHRLTGNSDGHMTPEEVERHLESRHSYMDLVLPERTPLTVPTEMFSHEGSHESDSNEGYEETSPSNAGDDVNIDFID